MLAPMNARSTLLFSGSAILLIAPLLAGAAQAPRCSDLYDDAQRLACYDAAFGKPVRPGTAPVAPQAAPTVGQSPAQAPAQSAVQSATRAPVAPVPGARIAPPVPEPPPAEKAPSSLTASISSLRRLSDERFVVTLDNGQVWEQIERDRAAEVKVGDRVTVRKAMLGSFVLVTASKVQTKVRLRP
jgi:hypothetical protein